MSTQLFRPSYQVDECLAEIRKVLESGWTGQGPQCAEFEKQFGEFVRAPYCHFVSSCTAALHIAMRLWDLPKGTLVATTPITFISSNAVILYEGLKPIFCDCGPDLSLSFESVIKAINRGAKAVMWVHYGGNVSNDFYQLMDYIKGKDIKVIEDCAHAAGAFYADGTRVGSRTDTISCFSYHSVKNLAIFDGGMINVPTKEMDTRARKLSWMGIDKSTFARTTGASNEIYKWSYNIEELGWKYNGNDIAASIGLIQLKYLDRDNAYRTMVYEQYRKALGSAVIAHNDGSSHHLAVAYVEDRDKTIATLKSASISPGVHYLRNYFYPVFAEYDHSLCNMIDQTATRIVTLPNHLRLTIADIQRIKEVLNAAETH